MHQEFDAFLIFILNVDYPFDNESLNKYLRLLAQIEQTKEKPNYDVFYFVGDINADTFSGRFWRLISNFMVQKQTRLFRCRPFTHFYPFVSFIDSELKVKFMN